MGSTSEKKATASGGIARSLSEAFLREYPAQAVRALERKPVEAIVSALQGLEPEASAALLPAMNRAEAAACLTQLPQHEASEILAVLGPEQGALLLRFLEKDDRRILLRAVGKDLAAQIEDYLRQAPESAAAFATHRVVVLSDDLFVEDALELIHSAQGELLSNLYVVDRNGRLVGVLGLDELLRAPRNVLVSSLTRKEIAKLNADSDLKTVLAHPGWRDYQSLPVVDKRGRFVGAIRYKMVQQLRQEAQRSSGFSHGGASGEIAKLYCRGLWSASELLGAMLGALGRSSKAEGEK